jgi:hypothetical protein
LRQKLLLLNLALAGAIVFTGVQLRDLYRAAKAREAAVLNQKVKPAPPPPITALPPAPAVMPSGYADIAQKMLFDRSRNPTVVVEVPAPPPPKPVPPFPVLKGMMNIGDGLTAVFAEKPGGSGSEVKPGERIGQFKLLAVNEEEAVFEWDGREFHKRVEDILDRTLKESAETSRPAAPPGVPPPAVVKTATGPGAQTGEATRACNPNDSTAPGAVVDGYRKVMTTTPFGQACRWEAVAR